MLKILKDEWDLEPHARFWIFWLGLVVVFLVLQGVDWLL